MHVCVVISDNSRALQFPDSALPVATRVSELRRVESPALAHAGAAAGGLAGAAAADMAAEGGDEEDADEGAPLDPSSREPAAAPCEEGGAGGAAGEAGAMEVDA